MTQQLSATVALDTSPLESGHQGRGVGTYTKNLQAALKSASTNLTFHFTPKPLTTSPDLIHYPYFDLFFHTLPLFPSTKTVVTIHDVIPLLFPKFFPPGIRGHIKFFLQQLALDRVDHIITDSLSSKKDIIKHLKVPAHKITTIYLAANSDFTPATKKQQHSTHTKYNLPDQFLLYVGDINYNKNLHTLIEAINQLNSIPLIIITRSNLNTNTHEIQTALTTNLIKSALNNLQNPQLVRFLKVDSQPELASLYSLASFYIQPSLSEGFGLPLLESVSCGTPLICSNAGSLPEVAGSAAIYFDPAKSSYIAKAITKALDLTAHQKTKLLRTSQSHAAQFSWDKTATQTINTYHQVLTKTV